MGRLTLLRRLAVRDVRRRPVEAVLVFLVIAAAATTLTVAFALRGVTDHPYLQTRTATAGPDVVAYLPPTVSSAPASGHPSGGGPSLRPLSTSQLSRMLGALAASPGVRAHSGPYPLLYSVIRFRGHSVDVAAEGRDQAPAAVDHPKVTSGGWLSPGGVVIERGFADALGVHVGDRVSIGGRPVRVVGIAVTAAVPAYPSSLCHLACPMAVPTNLGLVWLPRSAVQRLASSTNPVSYLIDLKLARPAQADGFVAARPPQPGAPVLLYSWQRIRDADTSLIQIEQVALQFGGWLLALLALAGLTVLVGRRMSEQTRRVGLLKAVGATPTTVALVLLVEHLALAACAAAVGLLAGRLLSPLLTSTGSGLVGSPGAPSITAATGLAVAAIAVAVAAVSSLFPALRAARTSTVSALADRPRIPPRRRRLIAFSARLPTPLLLALRQLSRRPRRALLNALSVTITVTGIVAILANHAHTSTTDPGITNLKITRLDEVTAIITIMLVILAAVNTAFVAWATATDARFASALQRALGATTRQVTTGLSIAPLLPALPGALLGVPLGLGIYHLLASGQPLNLPPAWQLAAVPLVAVGATTLLTAIPSRLAARRSPAQILQSE